MDKKDEKIIELVYDQLKIQSKQTEKMKTLIEQLQETNTNRLLTCNQNTTKFSATISKSLAFIKSIQAQIDQLITEVGKIKDLVTDHDRKLFELVTNYDKIQQELKDDDTEFKTLSKKVSKQEPFRLTVLAFITVLASIVAIIINIDKICNFLGKFITIAPVP